MKNHIAWSCIAVLPLVLACSAEGGGHSDPSGETADATEEPTAPALTLDVGDDRAVHFYDLGDGTTAIAESGPLGASSVLEGLDLQRPSVESVYRALRPGEALPAALDFGTTASLDGMGEATDASGEGFLPGPGEGDVGQARQPWTYQQFVDARGCQYSFYGEAVFSVCRGNLTSDYWAYAKAEWGYFRVAHQSGNGVRLEGRISGNLKIASDVPPGYWWNYTLIGPEGAFGDILDRTMRYDVVATRGDVYHVSGAWVVY